MFTLCAVVALIATPEIRLLAQVILSILPRYWWVISASSSGKYHPVFSLGIGGLLRHSIVTAVFAREIAIAWGLPQEMVDIATLAGLIHDGQKQGADGAEGHTVFEHPVLMAKFLRERFPGNKWAKIMAHMVESHMGKWNTSKYSTAVLPTPKTILQRLLSAADMCAATRELGTELVTVEQLAARIALAWNVQEDFPGVRSAAEACARAWAKNFGEA